MGVLLLNQDHEQVVHRLLDKEDLLRAQNCLGKYL